MKKNTVSKLAVGSGLVILGTACYALYKQAECTRAINNFIFNSNSVGYDSENYEDQSYSTERKYTKIK